MPLLGTGHRGRLSTTFEETTRQSTAVVAFAAIYDCAEYLVVGERKLAFRSISRLPIHVDGPVRASAIRKPHLVGASYESC